MIITIRSGDEIFKKCTYPGVMKDIYYISNYGRLYSVIKRKILYGYKSTRGYVRVKLKSDNGSQTHYSMHRLVAWEFCEGYSENENRIMVNHRDGATDNNFHENLEWCSQSENEIHKRKHLSPNMKNPPTLKGESNPRHVYTDKEVEEIREYLDDGYSIIEIMNMYGFKGQKSNKKFYSLIYDIKNSRSHKI